VESRVRAMGHPLHPMLVTLPIGLWTSAVVFDLIEMISNNAVFGQVAYWNIVAGLIGAALSAVTGLVDWTGVPANTRAKRVGLLHGGLNTLVVLLFLVAWLVRMDNPQHMVSGVVFAMEVVAIGVASVSAWYGGELVERLGIGVYDDANPDAPSSLRAS
jgi:uncharacterized membrane protein